MSDYARSTVQVALATNSYPIQIGQDLLSAADAFEPIPNAHTALIVSNETVAPLYGERLAAALSGRFERVLNCVLPDGEAFKDSQHLQRIYDALLQAACDRHTVLFALGGGVVGDMTGFAAATYMRGVRFVQVPTTLLAQVDSSVGGKTAINHPLGKNMIGAFHQPIQVLADLSLLRSLPPREVSAGLAEVIKYGPIADVGFLEWTEAHVQALRALEPQALTHAVARCCEIKAEVVGEDEKESGRRAILNFGHTFGHAIEAAMGYGQWLHGEAVGCGMVMAADLSHRLGLMSAPDVGRLQALVAAAGLPTQAPAIGVEAFMEHMRVDKKAQGGSMRFVVLNGWGQAILRTAPDAVVAEVIRTHSRAE